ncbi:MAG TPA: glycosyltransferase, partial [Longimicrobium sp.]|nr:glycosyltransferase [Longimicrobium sp.]
MSAAPLVSVVTPCHDAEPFVAETIESVLAQTHPAVEHVIVDDGSLDASWQVIERYAVERPDRVRALKLSPARGGSYARNRGAEQARGDYLFFLDADDVIAPDTLAALVEAARGAPDALPVCDWRRLRLEDGAWRQAPADVPFPPRDADWLRGWLRGPGWVPCHAILWPRAVYERTGGWDEALALNQDGDLALRALAGGARLVPARGGTSFYRTMPKDRASVTRSAVTERKVRSHLRVAEKVHALLEDRGMLERYREPLGVAYQKAALLGFREGHTELAREALRRGLALSGPRPVSESAGARALERLLGMERKEALMRGLARLGVMTPGRRRI